LCSLGESEERRREEQFEKDGIQCRALRNESAPSDWIDCTLLRERAWIESAVMDFFGNSFSFTYLGDFSPHTLTHQHIIPGVFWDGHGNKKFGIANYF
jgi:hypothetical protein